MRNSVSDWVASAREATHAAEVDRLLGEAAAQAMYIGDWRTLLLGAAELPLASRERLRAVAERTFELACEARDVWGFRDVASVRAARLDDAAGARAALDTCARLFSEPRTDVMGRAAAILGQPSFGQGYEWVLLSDGYAVTLGDEDGRRRCLNAGRVMARELRSASDMCSVATAWAAHVDRDAAGALVAEAEAWVLPGDRPAPLWTFANAWRAVGRADEARRVLDVALGGATHVAQAVLVAKVWTSHGEREQARAALDRAWQLAGTEAEWLAIAETAMDGELGDALVRDAIERAEGLASDTRSRASVSRAYNQWLRDDDAAMRVGPRGVLPELRRRRVRTLAGWEGSAAGLLDWLRARATPDTLTRIAEADYGMGAGKHRAALDDLCATGLVPMQLAWEPREVLELTRWSEGKGVDHVARALSCTVLCLCDAELEKNGPVLAESCLALGDEARRLAERFFVWLSETEDPDGGWDPEDGSGPDHPLALLLVFMLRAAAAPDEPRLVELAQMLVTDPTHPPAAVAAAIAGSMRAELWHDLMTNLLGPLRASYRHVERLLRALGRA